MRASVGQSLRDFPMPPNSDHTLACRCFCKDCLDFLVGPGTFEQLKEVEPWSCYMCIPPQKYGVLKLRVDWSTHVQEFFANNSAFQFVSETLTPYHLCFISSSLWPFSLHCPLYVFDCLACMCCCLMTRAEFGFHLMKHNAFFPLMT